ncbi:hypothetical protein N7507_010634 [Penicillium longicatenatum]|nr:hypothetical protein N7507_010634 [Penicillium longicatenatum]
MAFHTFSARRPYEFQGRPPDAPGHGRQLTEDEKYALIQVCHDLPHWGTFSQQPKSFWMQASRVFQSHVHRNYGWQACRRCMAKWEAENRPACLERPSIPSPAASEAGNCASSSSQEQNESNMQATNNEATQPEADAEDLPDHLGPTVRRRTQRTISEVMAKRKEFCRSVAGAMKDVERKIQYINDALDDDNLDHRRAIEQTFSLLMMQIAGSMERFEHRFPN